MKKSQSAQLWYLLCLFVDEASRKTAQGRLQAASETTELKQTFLLFYILDLDLKCTFKSPFCLVKIGSNINCREEGLSFLLIDDPCPSPSLFRAFYQFSGGVMMDQF